MKPADVNEAGFETEVLKAEQPVMADFWAPWCGPCRMVAPVVEELAGEYDGKLKVVKVNTDENSALASRLGIRGIPTLLFFKGGRESDRVTGYVAKAELKKHVDSVLK